MISTVAAFAAGLAIPVPNAATQDAAQGSQPGHVSQAQLIYSWPSDAAQFIVISGQRSEIFT